MVGNCVDLVKLFCCAKFVMVRIYRGKNVIGE